MEKKLLKQIVWLVFFVLVLSQSYAQFQYVYPLPGSGNHLIQTNIILRNGAWIDASTLQDPNLVDITGSLSGRHSWKAILSEDKTVIVKPLEPFSYGETVLVQVHDALRKNDGSIIQGTLFSFGIMKKLTTQREEQIRESDREMNREDLIGRNITPYRQPTIGYLDSMPTFTISVNNNAAPGQIFYSNQSDNDLDTNSFLTIINNDGSIVWAKDAGRNGHDFKINNNGYLTYFDIDSVEWIEMDSNYNRIDSFRAVGYGTNAHDMLIFPNKHSFVLGYDNQIMDLSQTIPGGQPDAQVKGLALQELDSSKNVIFEWRSLDYFNVTDADTNTLLTNGVVDFEHPNAIEVDGDGNILLSSRNMCEITKINLTTGAIMWRMGGAHNQFTFVNDNIPQHFSYQHDIRKIANGDITLFNNGNYLPVQKSSAKEYSLDETNKVATLAWYYEHPEIDSFFVFGRASGSVQRLPNGGTLICWGNIFPGRENPNMTEIDSNKNITWEFAFDSSIEQTYRAHKYNWNICSRVTGYTMQVHSDSSETTLSWGIATGAKSYGVEYRAIGTGEWQKEKVSSNSLILTSLKPATTYEWRIVTTCSDSPVIQSGYSRSDTFATPVGTGLNPQAALSKSVRVYPSFALNQVFIEVHHFMNPYVSIFNSEGVLLYTKLLQHGEDVVNQIDIQSWPAGVYVVRVTDGTGTDVQKFIRE